MRILYIHTKYLQSAGGEDSTLEAEVNLMREKGHEVMVTLFDNASMQTGLVGKLKAGISAIYNVASAREVSETLEKFRPDVVHVHNFFFTASPSVLIAVARKKIPLVVTIQNFRLVCANSLLLRNNHICELCIGHDFPWYGVKYKCYHNSAVQSAVVGATAAIHKWLGTWRSKVDIFITPSQFSRNKLLHSSLKPEPNKIEVKHNFIIDPGMTEHSQREAYYLFVGRLSAEKGVETMIKAWSLLPEANLVIAGDGPEGEHLRTKYADIANISFVGKKSRPEVLELMKHCKALIFPSIWYEGLPLTIIESLATGTPVLASSLGAMKEMITHGKNGLLFQPGDPKDLANAIITFNGTIANGVVDMYANARQTYLDEFHPNACYQQIMDIYNRLRALRNTDG